MTDGQTLVQEKFQTVMISVDNERAPTEIRATMKDSIDEANEFTIVSREFGMSWRDGLAKERQRAAALMQHDPKAGTRCIAFDGEGGREVGKLQGRCCCEGRLEVPPDKPPM